MDEAIRIPLEEGLDRSELFGIMDSHTDLIRRTLDVSIAVRDDQLLVTGPGKAKAARVLRELMAIILKGETLDEQKIHYVMNLTEQGVSYGDNDVGKDVICFTHVGKPLKAKTIGQSRYVQAIRNNDVVFGIGPAGTGKTYLAVAMAVTAFKKKQVERIILARPAVEAGESLGFLPGDLQEKVDPYLRPLYDALFDVLGRESAMRLKERGNIEIVPLAYMRGRTLDNSFIILDEAQNTTQEQMKMCLTRMGFGSRMVITGDVTQIDLPRGKRSGLKEAEKVLKGVEGVHFSYLKDVDVVRHELVRRIIKAYDAYHE